LLIEAYTWLTFCCNSNGKIAKAYAVNRRAESLALDRACWSWGLVMTARAYAHLLEGRFDESIAVAREAFALLRDEKRLQAIELSCGALVFANNQVYQGEPPRDDLLDELKRRADAHQMTEWQGMGQYPRMVHSALTGRAKEGQLAIAEAQPFSRRCGRGTVLEREIRLAQARLHVVQGQFEQALEVIDGAIALDGVVEMPYFTSRFYEIRGRACLALGELDAAWGDFAEVIAREEAYGLKFTLPEAYLGLSEVECRHGDLVSAQAFIERAQEILDVPGYRCEIKRIGLLHQMGRAALAAGRSREAGNYLESALAIARMQDNPYLSAQVLVDLGRAMQAAGESGAEACWQEALRLYEATENDYGAAQVRVRLEADSLGAHEAGDAETLLRQCSEALVASRSEEAVLESLLDHAQRAIAADRGAVVACTANGLLTIAGGERGAIRWGSGPAVDAAQVQRALALGGVQIAHDAGLRVTLALDTTLALCVEREAASAPLAPELPWLLRALAAVGRVALHNARSLAEEHRRAARLRILNEMSLVVSSSRDTEQILDHLLLQVLKLTGVEPALLVVARGGTFELLGARTSEAYEGPPGFSRSVVERVIHDQAALCVLDTESVISPSQSVFALGLKSVMAVPLAIEPQLPGALYVSSRVSAQAFNELDLELLRAIAAWAAIAYQHAQQARWLERHASENELALAIQQAEQHHLLEERRALDQELALARSIQQGFFPAPSRQASLDVHGACHAAREVGGDFYDVIALPGRRTAIAIGDVSGKGVSAALYMAVARTAMRMALPNAASPRECLIELNTRLREDLRDDNFITCFLGIYDEQTRHFAYASAGHQLAYHVGAEVRPLKGRGVPLGMDPEVFDATLTDQALTLAPGDRIALVTDGVLEALDPESLEFGEERLLKALAPDGVSAEEGVNHVLARVREHVAGAPAWDDMTVLVARAACTVESAPPPCSPISRA
ncbi:MAG TPA: GAF domain-containing SpoIIE family protein phosphatase, partial [Oscillatoriaceae cyanobacterium]